MNSLKEEMTDGINYKRNNKFLFFIFIYMKDINNYILEKLHINKEYKEPATKIKEGDYAYAVYVTGYTSNPDVHYVPSTQFKTIEEYEKYLLDRYEKDNIRYLQIFLSGKEAQNYEIKELPKLLKDEKDK